jgi:hypothetical protein
MSLLNALRGGAAATGQPVRVTGIWLERTSAAATAPRHKMKFS